LFLEVDPDALNDMIVGFCLAGELDAGRARIETAPAVKAA